jgi:four helix bundle protein
MANDIKYRCYQFAISIVKYLRSKKWDAFSIIISKQLMRSAMSVGANVVEAVNSSSRLEFKRYYEIALKSGNETKYWLCILRDGFDIKDEEIKVLLKESDELCKILATSVISLKSKREK